VIVPPSTLLMSVPQATKDRKTDFYAHPLDL